MLSTLTLTVTLLAIGNPGTLGPIGTGLSCDQPACDHPACDALACNTPACDAAGTPTSHHCHYCGVKTCRLKVTASTKEKSCYVEETKDICIPPVTFPWQCRPQRCAKVRTVKVLKTEKYEVPTCKYTWEVITICPSCQGGLKAAGCDVAPGVVVAEPVTDDHGDKAQPQPPQPTPDTVQ